MIHRRARAPIGALGLGVLAVVLLHFGGDAPIPTTGLASVELGEAPRPPEASEVEPTPELARLPVFPPRVAARNAAVRQKEQRLLADRRGRRTSLAQLRTQSGWIRFLETWRFLPPETDPARRLQRIANTLALATDPVVRQNLIFLAALALPTEVSRPWLEVLRRGADAADAEDALCALAFSGEPEARAAFLRLAQAPAHANVHRIVDLAGHLEAIEKAGTGEAREVLRSYRCLEALDRVPYFKITAYLASHRWGGNHDFRERIGWTRGYAQDRETPVAILRAWLARYPGHPGSDDVALRIGRLHAERGDRIEAVRWYSRAATLPDQDKAYRAARLMASECELYLSPEEVLRLSEDEGRDTPNRRYYQYVWLRRLAAGRGFETAIQAWEALAAHEPASELAVAWRRRLTVSAPKGLDSGITPLPKDDPLRLVRSAAAAWPARDDPARKHGRERGIYTGRSWPTDEHRLHPWPEVAVLDRDGLVKQARAWLTLAELEHRAARAGGTRRADLLYKQAAVFYHDRDLLFPAYGRHTYTFRGLLTGPWPGTPEEKRRRDEANGRFETQTLSYVRAIALFERIEREQPDYERMDKVIFSEGLAWRLLIDYRPHFQLHPYLDEGHGSRKANAIRKTAQTFERCAARHPSSTLADDALAAAAYWRRTRPQAFLRD